MKEGIINGYGIVYKIFNKLNGKVYIGQTIRIDTWINYKYWGGGKILKPALKEYGRKNFSREILGVYNSQEELDEAERIFIITFNCIAPNGYNLAEGGRSGGKIWTTEERRKSGNKKLSDKRNSFSKEDWEEITRKRKETISKYSEEEREVHFYNRSESHKKYYKTLTDEGRRNLSESSRKAQNRPEVRDKKSISLKKTWESKEKREIHSKRMTKILNIEKTRKKNSESHKELWNNKNEEEKKVVLEILQNNANLNKEKVWVNNNDEAKMIFNLELDQYLSSGWSLGRLRGKEWKTSRNKVWVNKNGKQKTVNLEELDQAILDGWSRGRKSNELRPD